MTRAPRIPSFAEHPLAARPSLAVAALVLLSLLPWLTGCESKRGIAEGVVFSFLSATQLEDHDALYCLLHGASEIEGGPVPSPHDARRSTPGSRRATRNTSPAGIPGVSTWVTTASSSPRPLHSEKGLTTR